MAVPEQSHARVPAMTPIWLQEIVDGKAFQRRGGDVLELLSRRLWSRLPAPPVLPRQLAALRCRLTRYLSGKGLPGW